MTYYKHLVTKDRVVFRTYGVENVQYLEFTKQEWLVAGRPERLE